jgi:HlyD family secretion protein
VDVGSQVSGRIQELFADFNSPVKKGQLIAKIDPALFQASVFQAEANVAAAKANVTRLTVSAEDSERQARASLEQARTNLRYTDILSPTDGVVISRAVNVGQTVAASLSAPVIFTIAQDLKKMEVHTNVAESDIGRLKPGMRVTFTVDAYPGEPFRGSIRDIRNAPQVVSNVVTYDAVIDVSNEALKLKPGMTATVSVITERRMNVLAVPNAALRFRPDGIPIPGGNAGAGPGQRERGQGGQSGGDGSQRRQRGEPRDGDGDGDEEAAPRVVKRTVYVLVNGEPQPREVTTGITDGRLTEITGGTLKVGEMVIVSAGGQGANAQRGQGQRGFRIL